MNILYIVPYTPNLIRVRSFNLINALRARGHQITLFTLWSSVEERTSLNQLRDNGIQVHAWRLSRWRSFINCLSVLPTSTPLQAAYSWHPDLAQTLINLINKRQGSPLPDVIHVEHLRGARYGINLQVRHSEKIRQEYKHTPIVWDSVDCITHLFRQAASQSRSLIGRWMTRFELGRTARFEAWLLDKFDHILVTSSIDRDALVHLRPYHMYEENISVLPNGVDLNYFSPPARTSREQATLVVSGKMSYHANVTMTIHLVKEIMPLVWSHRPDVLLTIVGKDPGQEIKALDQHPNITVTGTVPDIRPHLRRASIAVTPIMYGAGIQNKILEAMACGTPVITTPQAIKSLNTVIGRDLLVGGNPDSIARAILDLLDDSERQNQIGNAGRRYVEKNHDWLTIADQLGRIYQETIRKNDHNHKDLST